jgi:hypothetical protein
MNSKHKDQISLNYTVLKIKGVKGIVFLVTPKHQKKTHTHTPIQTKINQTMESGPSMIAESS